MVSEQVETESPFCGANSDLSENGAVHSGIVNSSVCLLLIEKQHLHEHVSIKKSRSTSDNGPEKGKGREREHFSKLL